VTSTLMRALKDGTAHAHRLVESELELLDPHLDRARVARVVEQLYGFWSGTEPAIDRWAGSNPAAAEMVNWPRRRRTEIFAQDLRTLGRSPAYIAGLASAPPVFAAVGLSQVFGWLYVAEGSTLGGAVIDRHLRRPALADIPMLQSFTPYREGPGPMWQDYSAQVNEWVIIDPRRAEAVTAAAVDTFTKLQAWVCS
jgi:heme oxygenase